MPRIIFFDIETDSDGKKILEIGAIDSANQELKTASESSFYSFIRNADYLCGHNIFEHDLKYLHKIISKTAINGFIDTLYLSPLLFPSRPYHSIGKQYKITSDEEFNNPLFDSRLARDLFSDEINAFNKLKQELKTIFYSLLHDRKEFKDFFRYIKFTSKTKCRKIINSYFNNKICTNANISKYIKDSPIELAYALSLINAEDKKSITPPWLLKHYPRVLDIMHNLRSNRCREGCSYCNDNIDPLKALQRFFKYPTFRLYKGDTESLQEKAVSAAIDGKSMLVVFPTGGGKSITFQLPALIHAETIRGLTVVISPLQSLMKDQVDNLDKIHITEAVTINGALDPIERAKAFERIEDGSASILYISPESLRSKSIETLLMKRNIVRFVIDEAHCFSSWGQDFRVDYLYIGVFIKEIQKKKNLTQGIPVSCFTATAKQKVIEDIKDYFKTTLSLELLVFSSDAKRENLTYFVRSKKTKEEKYQELRNILEMYDTPAIVYVSRTRSAEQISDRLNTDGVFGGAVPYHGKMDREIRIRNQERFMNGETRIIVATTAFGMGVDKENVGIVVHYDISSSLEDYVQESGRAGRSEAIKAECFILYDEDDLNKHFTLLNQSKISINEIRQIWKAMKEITKQWNPVMNSALEIARVAGWDESVVDIETRVKTAIAALEDAKYVKRGQNMPKVFADSVLVKNMQEATDRIDLSLRFTNEQEKEVAKRIIKSLISSKQRAKALGGEGESRIDYLSDILGIEKSDVIRAVNIMREEKILSDDKDLVAFIKKSGKANTSLSLLREYEEIEARIIDILTTEEQEINLKEINEEFEKDIKGVSVKKLKMIFNFYSIKQLIKRTQGQLKDVIVVNSTVEKESMIDKFVRRIELSVFIIEYVFGKIGQDSDKEEIDVEFSCLEIKSKYENRTLFSGKITFDEIDDSLYYLTKIGALRLEGAFLVIYNPMCIERIEMNNHSQYKKEDYKKLENFYRTKVEQIHIVGEYAKRMSEDYRDALHFVNDYFQLSYDSFIKKYFKGREKEIVQNITPKKFEQLFGGLSEDQLSIIKDKDSKYIVVAAGPGSGKTKLLVHKLASLYMMEDVKHEQMLMLTFSRASATEFKKRLMSPNMLGTAANFLQIATFHSYCFDLLGRVGSLVDSDTVIEEAVRRINTSEIEASRITKTVLVIDEAQDMSEAEFSLVEALMASNEGMRIIAVGDDDQNIYEFRKSDSKYMRKLIEDYGARKYDLLTNYRSGSNIVALANAFVKKINLRLKDQPIVANQGTNGEIIITKYESPNLCVPVIEDIISKSPSGTICVLTETNDDAATIAGLLIKKGISARLIQDNNGFNLYNLVEIRYFVESLKICNNTSTIDDELWQSSKLDLEREFSLSTTYEYAMRLINDFEETNPVVKYMTDFLQFIYESKLEDFYEIRNSLVIVSTIHKAKGREFDNVFLVLKQNPSTDDKYRTVYVAITRAKSNLYVHCTVDCFDDIYSEGINKRADEVDYPLPSGITVNASHRDVNLFMFARFIGEIGKMKSGDPIDIRSEPTGVEDDANINNYFAYSIRGNKVLQFSKAMCRKIDEMRDKGFNIKSASIRLIVWWKSSKIEYKDDPETRIVLPTIHFVSNS